MACIQSTQCDGPAFGVCLSSSWGRDDADIDHGYVSTRPEKQLAELAVLEAAFTAWIAARRAILTPTTSEAHHGERSIDC